MISAVAPYLIDSYDTVRRCPSHFDFDVRDRKYFKSTHKSGFLIQQRGRKKKKDLGRVVLKTIPGFTIVLQYDRTSSSCRVDVIKR